MDSTSIPQPANIADPYQRYRQLVMAKSRGVVVTLNPTDLKIMTRELEAARNGTSVRRYFLTRGYEIARWHAMLSYLAEDILVEPTEDDERAIAADVVDCLISADWRKLASLIHTCQTFNVFIPFEQFSAEAQTEIKRELAKLK